MASGLHGGDRFITCTWFAHFHRLHSGLEIFSNIVCFLNIENGHLQNVNSCKVSKTGFGE